MSKSHHFFKATPQYLIDEFFNDNIIPVLENMASREGAANDAYVTLLGVLNAKDEQTLVSVASKYYDEKYHDIFIALHRLLHGKINKSDFYIKDILDPRLGATPGQDDVALNQLGELYRSRVLDWMKQNAPAKIQIAVDIYNELTARIKDSETRNVNVEAEVDDPESHKSKIFGGRV